jgi:hypothetical protein
MYNLYALSFFHFLDCDSIGVLTLWNAGAATPTTWNGSANTVWSADFGNGSCGMYENDRFLGFSVRCAVE